MDCDAIVLGAGIVGLTSAIRLTEAGARVRIWSPDPSAATTSAVAGALWEPYRIEPRDRVEAWARDTLAVLTSLAAGPATGVRLVEGTQALDGPAAPLPYWTGHVPGVRRAAPEELPPGVPAAFRARLPLIDMPTHLGHLLRRFTATGGTVERRAAGSLTEAARHAPLVVNCTGLAARELVPDPRVRPVRGRTVVVANPGVTEWFVDADDGAEAVYLFPQPYGLLLGGTAEEDAWDTAPDPRATAAVVARCARIVPAVATAPVLAERTGLRPWRDAVRLEAETLPDGTRCVHNYGHGGAGVTVAWGCAAEVVRLAAA
ncbi:MULTISPECIES: FAD-dependent oxidoreductase [Streptomycetaceae]|uniref:D-amino-acid oxidase n=1 Tax=Streptantibioticus cattleyicolor (strain ATCC 35852 / DSM 46488 / JCM 4925 / NBRC 14057 / NRRL 8057) TaxID=1003195 RepID=F8JPF7_STREN|nr:MULTISPECIES: FAD-dependent oxidoreductase [Streptomycetaceae]AEW96514.1 D-amino acid oxidase [Streptantibioticus cattleyicolor NRRL 8057 = DSM 46488]MYS61017.1 FAD-dependent oxidoreductase [Streptomyces sp. SID5468]CCB76852.1 D-amino acid oxidase [Streptantibioticus cattleyicolor NRRL 8057 = DSM 46488]